MGGMDFLHMGHDGFDSMFHTVSVVLPDLERNIAEWTTKETLLNVDDVR
jgi:hypothetical protein